MSDSSWYEYDWRCRLSHINMTDFDLAKYDWRRWLGDGGSGTRTMQCHLSNQNMCKRRLYCCAATILCGTLQSTVMSEFLADAVGLDSVSHVYLLTNVHCVQKKVSPLKILQYHEQNFTELSIILPNVSHTYFKQGCDISAKYALSSFQRVQHLCQSMQCDVDHCLTCSLQTPSCQSGAADVSWKPATSFFLEIQSLLFLQHISFQLQEL